MKEFRCSVPAGNRLDASAYLCVDAAARNRQNQLRPSSPLWPVVTRRACINSPAGDFVHLKVSIENPSWRQTGLEYILRFLAGGIAVSGFAALSDVLRPKSFAGLFGAAPSIALATISITLFQSGAPFAAVEGRSMIIGALAMGVYSWIVSVLIKKLSMTSLSATIAALTVWFALAFGLTAMLFGAA